MSNFTPLVTRKFTFNEDEVTIIYARLKRKLVLKLAPLMNKAKLAKEKADQDAEFEASADVLSTLLDHLPDYVKSIEGLTDADGTAITVEQLTEEVYFIDLATDVAMHILDDSLVITGRKGKNLSGGSGEGLEPPQ